MALLAIVGASAFNLTDVDGFAKGFSAGYLGMENNNKVQESDTPLKASNSIGLDISQPLDASTAQCFVAGGYGSILIPRAYRSDGAVDQNACGSLQSAKDAGINNRHVYLFPCPTCGSASDQISALKSYLSSCSAFNGKVWLDIEGDQYWLGDSTSNRKWYEDLVDACKSSFSCGVYSSYYQWQGIMGSIDYAYGSNLPLWYAHYDGNADFSDYTAFGSWSKPWAKQYEGDKTLCDFGVDKNYAPNV
jgi:hypothetical protein